ncbi:ABC transporter ATP-binding protein [Pontixanthobacter aestiaquae]|uniref:ATP-binding cassette domain-containing protein n=1 Tax=Pontixanthobacter aestiaquae TaxID=1509367 RepID=A0A844Z7P0_9SPHN|nr:ABC transporter ATP-binding protein [Pontixanthobacter aestiaquae]MDN3645075.1 ABC transporter ATP-binding protein [Pontixanthobacter aestiaquae]MXO83925.1 ATP-binding cassette domain-containing protein [Pontixanthobacter aestiaquae]
MTLSVNAISLAARLSGVSAALQPGQITAICGPNGAGKSTLLSVLAGLLVVDSGTVQIGDDTLNDLPPKVRARRIGYLPQNGEAAWDVAVRNVVALGRMPHGDMAERPVDAALEALNLTALSDRPMSRLSGGERARTFLARVLAGQPQWILADEPLAALDIAHQLALIGHLKREALSGTGVVLVLHDLSLAMNHADRVLVLGNGALAADGAPQNALDTGVIERVWGVSTEWLGKPGERALIARPPGP